MMVQRLSAILAADVVGYSSMMSVDEHGTLAALREHRKTLFDPEILRRGGRVVKLMGDGTLCVFASVGEAVDAALAIQRASARAKGPIRLRIGVHLGDVIIDGDDIYGNGVNIAVRLESLAATGGICVSDQVHASIVGGVAASFADAGEQHIKGLSLPLRLWCWSPDNAEHAALAVPVVESRTHSREMPTLAVLPFRYEAIDPGDMLAEGIVDEIIGALGRVRQFYVIARQSVYALKQECLDIPAAARRLGADYLVDGSVRQAGERIRVAVELAGADGRTLWQARFDEHLDNLFDLQDRIAMQVAGQLPVPLRAAEIARARSLAPGAAGVRALILQAMPLFWAVRPDANDQALALFRRAQALDRDDAQALAYGAWALAQRVPYMWSRTPEDDRRDARRMAEHAAQVVGDDPAALTGISAAYSLAHIDRSAAISFARRALAIDPSCAWASMRLGWALFYDRKPREAIVQFDNAIRLSPLDPFRFNMNMGKATALRECGELDEAIAIAEQTVIDYPGIGWTYRTLARLHAQAGNVDRAIAAGRMLLAAHPDFTLRRLRETLPSLVFRVDDTFLESLRRAGIPEE